MTQNIFMVCSKNPKSIRLLISINFFHVMLSPLFNLDDEPKKSPKMIRVVRETRIIKEHLNVTKTGGVIGTSQSTFWSITLLLFMLQYFQRIFKIITLIVNGIVSRNMRSITLKLFIIINDKLVSFAGDGLKKTIKMVKADTEEAVAAPKKSHLNVTKTGTR